MAPPGRLVRSVVLLGGLALAGCWRATPPAPATAAGARPDAAPAPGVVPAVAIIPAAEWEACETCDDQSLEGGAPLRFTHLPAVTRDGALIAVVEERDGWGHVPVPGVRLIDRAGKPVTWLPLGGTGAEAEAAVAAANRELARHAWLPLELPPPVTRELPDDGLEVELAFGPYTARYRQRHDGDVRLPPAEIRVVDGRGRVVVERRDTERAWHAPPACNLPAFALAGVSAAAGVMLFTTRLGMGGHNCDGIEQRPAWHVLALPRAARSPAAHGPT